MINLHDTHQLDGLRSSKSNVPVCFYCKKKATSWVNVGNEKRNVQPNSLAVPRHVQPTSDSRLVPLSLHEQFNPFVSKGSVSMSVPITILRKHRGNSESHCGKYLTLIQGNSNWSYHVHPKGGTCTC